MQIPWLQVHIIGIFLVHAVKNSQLFQDAVTTNRAGEEPRTERAKGPEGVIPCVTASLLIRISLVLGLPTSPSPLLANLHWPGASWVVLQFSLEVITQYSM